VDSPSFSRIMFLPPLYANVPRHLPPPPPPPFPGAPPPSSGPPPPPPSFPGAPPPPPVSGEAPGLCGLTNNQWHLVLILCIPREWAIHPFRRSFPYSLERDLISYAYSAVLFALLIAIVISWFNGSEISLLWLRVQDRAKLTRMGTFPHFSIPCVARY
jgi:hypothetical protein